MNKAPDTIDARLLDILQSEFPLNRRPFAVIADRLSISPEDIMLRISRLKSDGIIRQISAIFDSAALGYQSVLVAFKVDDHKYEIDSIAQNVSRHPGVSHCYSRDAKYNLWFTLTVGSGSDLECVISELANFDGVESYLILPATRVFKIGVFLRMADNKRMQPIFKSANSGHAPVQLSPEDLAAVKALQRDLPVVEAPFAALAEDAGMLDDDLLDHARRFLDNGVMRRFAAVLRHQHAGYKCNAMICWKIERDMVEKTGLRFAQDSSASHCYERPTSPDWPYSLYTMVHARTEDELQSIIGRLAQLAEGAEHIVLRSIKEYKKSRVVYFAD